MNRVLQAWLIAVVVLFAADASAIADPDPALANEGQHRASLQAPPILVKPPFPSGYKPPVNLHMPQSIFIRVPKSADWDSFQTPCLAFDIGVDGRVSNIVVLRPSGITEVDQFAVASAADSLYQPATVNGKSIVQRIISERQYNFGQHHSSGPTCSWVMYDAYMAKHSAAPDLGQSAPKP